jgi:hypothetical protein
MTKSFLEKVESQERKVLAIDFDGVIHKNSLGFHDGTVYDDPIDGSLDALEELSKEYEIIIFSCKALEDRPLIEGKTGIRLIEEWLSKYDVLKYVKEVTFKKPRAYLYIDDKGYRFQNWKDSIDFIRGK